MSGRARLGFSLMETVIATALLAMIAAACMPLVRAAADATARRADERSPDTRLALALLADQVAVAPDAFGIDATTLGVVPIEWPEEMLRDERWSDATREGVTAEVIAAWDDGPSADEVTTSTERWILVRSGAEVAPRWCLVPTDRARADRPRVTPRRRRTTGRTPLRSRTRRGLTLLEVLVALAIVSSLALAVFTWVSSVARAAQAASSRASRDATIAGILRSIQDDLACRDFGAARDDPERRVVSVDAGTLIVRTRAPSSEIGSPEMGSSEIRGPIRRAYHYEQSDRMVVLRETTDDGVERRSILARRVDVFEVILAERGDQFVLSVAIDDGPVARRRFLVP